MAKRRVWGAGRIYKPTYRTKGGVKETRTYWCEFSRDGVKFRENTRTASPREAQDFLTTCKGLAQRGEFSSDVQKVTFAELAEDLRVDYLRKSNRSGDRLELSLMYILPFFGHWRAKDIGSKQLAAYIKLRQKNPGDPGADAKLSRGASPATVNRELSAIRRAFRVACDAEPPKAFRVPKIRNLGGEHVREGFFSRADFLAVRQELPEHLQGLAVCGYWTGMRLRELTGLRWGQVNMQRRTLKVTRFQSKNKRERTLVLPPEAWDAIEAQKQRRDREFPKAEFVFFSDTGGQILSHYNAWRSACKRAGIVFHYHDGDGIVRPHRPMFHDLRRTAATNLANAGVPLRVIQDVGGWRSAEISNRYQLKDESNFAAAAQSYAALVEAEDREIRQRIGKGSHPRRALPARRTA